MSLKRNLINNENINSHIESRAGGCKILCLECNKRYIAVTCRRLNKRIYEHKRDLKRANINIGLVKHNLGTNQNLNFKESNRLVCIDN